MSFHLRFLQCRYLRRSLSLQLLSRGDGEKLVLVWCDSPPSKTDGSNGSGETQHATCLFPITDDQLR